MFLCVDICGTAAVLLFHDGRSIVTQFAERESEVRFDLQWTKKLFNLFDEHHQMIWWLGKLSTLIDQQTIKKWIFRSTNWDEKKFCHNVPWTFSFNFHMT